MTNNGYGLRRPQVERTGKPAAMPDATLEVKPLEPLEEKTFAYLCVDGCGEVKPVSKFPEGVSKECLECRDRRLRGLPPISPPDQPMYPLAPAIITRIKRIRRKKF